MSTSCVALSEMAEKMLSKVLWGPSSSASKKCVTEVAPVTVGWGLVVTTRPQKRPSHAGVEILGQEGKERVKRKLAKSG